MPAPRKRPAPPERMTALLADAKQQLLASGFALYVPDDPEISSRAAMLDRQRSELRLTIDLLREDDPRGHADRLVELAGQARLADSEFADLLRFLPAMAAFEHAWDRAWAIMVTERAWPHATAHRRAWRRAMIDCKPENRACFLGQPTGFQRYRDALIEALDNSRFAASDTIAGLLVA